MLRTSYITWTRDKKKKTVDSGSADKDARYAELVCDNTVNTQINTTAWKGSHNYGDHKLVHICTNLYSLLQKKQLSAAERSADSERHIKRSDWHALHAQSACRCEELVTVYP